MELKIYLYLDVSREAQWRKAKEWRSHVMTFPSLLADTARLPEKKVSHPLTRKLN
jgi:hypothetical protein